MTAKLRSARALGGIVVGAVLLRVIAGVGFANYDTLYALVWGQQLSRGQTPSYGIPIAPTPHPLVEALGLVLSPLGARGMEDVTVGLGFLALSATGWMVYRLGAEWFGRAAGILAAAILLTRVPILSYGVRAYVDVPYLLLVLGAILVETRRPRAGTPVLGLLAVAGLLRPEAWGFSGLYWLYLAWPTVGARRGGESREAREGRETRTPVDLVGLALLVASAPLLWALSDLLVTGDALWSLTNTRATAETLDRVSGIANVPEYIPRRIGEILRPPVLLGAGVGGVLSLLWFPRRARLGALAGVIAVAVFALFAAVGLPINTRYAFLAASILCLFCGAGVFGWTLLPAGDPHRRWWIGGAVVVAIALLAYIPSQYRAVSHEMRALAEQAKIQDDLVALVDDHAISPACGPVGVPNHRPIPMLALRLGESPADILSAQVTRIADGTYVDPADHEVEADYTLDAHDPHPLTASVPPGFTPGRANRSWQLYERCAR